MQKTFVYILLFLTLVGCNTSDKVLGVTSNRFSTVYKFKNSKTIVFNDSLTKSWLIRNDSEIPISISEEDIRILNNKLKTGYLSFYKKRYIFDYSSLPNENDYKIRDRETIKYIRNIQKQMNFLDKQLVCYKDSLGLKIIRVNIITPDENNIEAENRLVGKFIDVIYDLENSKLLVE